MKTNMAQPSVVRASSAPTPTVRPESARALVSSAAETGAARLVPPTGMLWLPACTK